jgi:NADPH:quinone reductase-like Zn-dependent oxidoreductase
MLALSHDRFGGPEVLRLGSWPTPEPGPGEVLVRVRAASLNPKDAFLRKGRFRLLARAPLPRLVGHDFAGVVDAIGPGASRAVGTSVGERVFGALAWSGRRGTLAEHVVVRVGTFARMHDHLDFEHAAAMPIAALTSLQALRDVARIGDGDAVLVHGASGGVGTFAIQIARRFGARVTTTSSEANQALCRELGSHEALDYRTGEHLRVRERFRIVFDVMGNLGFARAKRMLVRGGVHVSTVPSARLALDIVASRFTARRAALVVVRSRAADLATLSAWVGDGSLRPALDQSFDLADHAAAFARLESRRARGKVVVRVP